MKTKMTIEELAEKILECDKELENLKDKDLSKFSEKYLDSLELRELYYNISNYAS